VKAIIVIPARYESSRLPGKPLIDLLGVSMIRRTHSRCIKAFPRDQVYVATDNQRIFEHCRENDIQVLMTPDDCLTGTDRVACVARNIDADLYINVQGDEPTMDPQDILDVYETAKSYPGEIVNGMCKINDESLFRNPTIPKVVARPDGRLLYMSRAAIPTSKQLGFNASHRQICTYAFPKKALEDFYSCKEKTPLEAIEDIEILRFLELGYEVQMVPLSDSSVAVDTPEDIPRAEAIIKNKGLLEI